MLGPFSFVHEGRTYSCEARDGVEGQMWWWFSVSSDGNRYAPFPAASKDTRAALERRIVEYYTNHLARRAAPEQPHWAKRGRPAGPGKPLVAGASAKPGEKPVVPGKPMVSLAAAHSAAAAAAKRPVAAPAVQRPPAAKKAAPKRAAAPRKVASKRAAPARRAVSKRAAPARKRAARRAAPRKAARPAAKGKRRSRR